MDLDLVEEFAIEMINDYAKEYPVLHGYSFEWDRSKNSLGACHYIKRKIYLSKILVPAVKDQDEIIDTLLHELAHALAFHYDQHGNHGQPWKNWASRIGAKPERCYSNEIIDKSKITYKYDLYCPECDKVISHKSRLDRLAKAGFRWYSCRKHNGRRVKLEIRQNY